MAAYCSGGVTNCCCVGRAAKLDKRRRRLDELFDDQPLLAAGEIASVLATENGLVDQLEHASIMRWLRPLERQEQDGHRAEARRRYRSDIRALVADYRLRPSALYVQQDEDGPFMQQPQPVPRHILRLAAKQAALARRIPLRFSFTPAQACISKNALLRHVASVVAPVDLRGVFDAVADVSGLMVQRMRALIGENLPRAGRPRAKSLSIKKAAELVASEFAGQPGALTRDQLLKRERSARSAAV